VYSLGCVLFYMLAGHPPFARDGDEARLWAHLTERPPAVSAAAPGVPPGFDDVLARALAKDPAERFQSAGDLGRAAAAAASGGRAAERDTVVATGAAAPIEVDTRTAGTAIAPPEPAAPPGRRRARTLAIAAVAATLVAIGGLGALSMRGDGGDRTGAPESPVPTPAPARERGLEVSSTRIGGRPNNVIGAEGRIWAGRFLSRRLLTLDPATGRQRPAPRPETGVGLTGIARDGDTLWALAARDRRLVHLDARSGKLLGEPVPLPSAGNAIAVGDDAVYVALSQPQLDPGDQIVEIDSQTGATRRTLDVRDGVRRLTIFRGRLWLLASSDAELIGMDLRDPSRRMHVTFDTDSSGDLASGAGYLWATLVDADQVARIDPRTGAVATFATGRGPSGVVVRKGTAWVANRASSTLTKLDIRSGRVRGEIEVPLNPYEIAAYRDAIWISCLADGRIARVTGLDD
jgi:streptogramin lyase